MADDGNDKPKHFRSPTVLMAIGVAATLILALVVVMALLRTGGAKAVSDNAALIGALVALGGVFTAQMVGIALEDRRTQETRALEDRREEDARRLEDQREHDARRLEDQRAGEAALQNYFKDVGELLIEKPLRRADPGDNLSTVVRAQTLAVLEGLDPDRKRILLLFLYESGLIHKDKLVVSLIAAELSRINLREAILREADLSGTNLERADLERANLERANLERVQLEEANLDGARLESARLRGANLRGARLVGACLRGAFLDDSILQGQRQVKGPPVHLENAILSGAHLEGATLFNALLDNANLAGTHLEGTDLRQAKRLTQEQVNVAIGDANTMLPNGLRVPPEWEKQPGNEGFK